MYVNYTIAFHKMHSNQNESNCFSDPHGEKESETLLGGTLNCNI